MEEQPAWHGTLVCDQYAGYDSALEKRVYTRRIAAHCVAYARRKFDELVSTSKVAKEAIKRIGWIYHVEGQLNGMDAPQRLSAREQLTQPLWKELHVWLKLERSRVSDGGSIAGAIDYSLNSWTALTRNPKTGPCRSTTTSSSGRSMPDEKRRRYLYVAIDRATRWVYMRIY